MPKTPIDYSKGLIYSIVCKTDEKLIYIGSTTNFTKRKNQHKTACHNENIKDYNYKVYVMIRANGGWDNFDMKPVKEYACENAIQLVIEEERIRKEMQANLNAQRAFRTEEELKADLKKHNNDSKHKDYLTKYVQDNRAIVNEAKQRYNKANKDKSRQYYQDHKDEIKKKESERRLAKKKLSASIE